MSPETQAMLRDAVRRHVATRPQLADDFAVTFGRGNVDLATQWLHHQLSQHGDEVAEAAGAAEIPVDAVAFEESVLAAISDIPGAEELSKDEIEAIMLDVLGEDDE